MTEPNKPETPWGSPETPPPSQQPQPGAPGSYHPPPPPPYQQGQYPGAGYPPPPPPPYAGGFTPPPTGPKNGLGIASLVIAIVALVMVWSVFGGVILGIVAVVIGFVARARVTKGEATNGGVAIAGIVLGFLAIVVGLAFIAIWFGVFREVGGSDYIDCVQRAGQDEDRVRQCAVDFRENVEDQFGVTMTPTR